MVGSGEAIIETRNASEALMGASKTIIGVELPYRELSGVLEGQSLLWDSTAIIHITGNSIVPSGGVLTIGGGTIIELDYHVRIEVEMV